MTMRSSTSTRTGVKNEAMSERPPHVGAIDARWAVSLTPDPSRPVRVPCCTPELLTRLTAMAGPDPVAWALQVGETMAEIIVEQIAYFGSTEELRELLRAATESAVLGALGMFVGPTGEPPPLTLEARRAVGYYAEHGVALEDILQGIRSAHAEMSAAFLEACDTVVEQDERILVLRKVSAQLFEHMDRYARDAADLYNDVRARWEAGSTAVTRRAVDAILGGAAPDRETSAALSYDLTLSHRAVVLTAEGPVDGLEQTAYDLLRRLGATAQLIVPVSSSVVWAWAGRRHGGPPATADAVGRPGVRVAIGSEAAGAEGFRASHRQAVDVARLLAVSTAPHEVLTHDTVEPAVLLAGDLPAAREFVRRTLGPLADPSPRAMELLATVKTYLDLSCSPSAVADRLHLARNTVSARVARASRELGREIGDDCLDLHCALLLVDVLGTTVLTDP